VPTKCVLYLACQEETYSEAPRLFHWMNRLWSYDQGVLLSLLLLTDDVSCSLLYLYLIGRYVNHRTTPQSTAVVSWCEFIVRVTRWCGP